MKTLSVLIRLCLLATVLLSAFTSQAQTNATKIAAGDDHTLFVDGYGTLWAMGLNNVGQLGDGDTNNVNSPEKIAGNALHFGNTPSPTVTAVAARYEHSLFLMSDGSMWAMGQNNHGEFGNGSTTDSDAPVEILTNEVVAIAAGAGHTLFKKQFGTFITTRTTQLWSVGLNNFGQLGNNSTSDSSSPVLIESGTILAGSIVGAIAAGDFHSLFTENDGSLWAMGSNDRGQLGNGTTNDSHVPIQILASNVTAVAAGFHHSFIIKSDGSLWASGDNTYGELGNGTTNDIHGFAMIVSSNVTSVAAGTLATFFTKSDGSLWGMGFAAASQLTGFLSTNQPTPLLIVAGGVTAAAAGDFHSLFLTSDGSLWGMGADPYGALGNKRSSSPPFEIIGPLVANGGFETGDFLGWDTNSLPGTNYMSGNPRFAHAGNFGLRMPLPGASTGKLSQNLRTIPGCNYSISFWLNCDGVTPNGFAAVWNGTNLFNRANLPNLGWTNLQFTVPASASNTLVQFLFTNASGYFGLDEITAVQLTQPVITSVNVALKTNLVLNVANGLAKATYWTLMGTNLTEPVEDWTPVATNTLTANQNFTITITNTVSTRVPQRYYIIQVPLILEIGP